MDDVDEARKAFIARTNKRLATPLVEHEYPDHIPATLRMLADELEADPHAAVSVAPALFRLVGELMNLPELEEIVEWPADVEGRSAG